MQGQTVNPGLEINFEHFRALVSHRNGPLAGRVPGADIETPRTVGIPVINLGQAQLCPL